MRCRGPAAFRWSCRCSTPSAVDGVLERLDGLLLSGGGDIDPALYGAEPDPHLDGVDADRDAYELALVRRAVERGIPVLGVCRGAQVINVARGGSLIQHLDDHTDVQHQERLRYDSVIHHVSIVPGSRVADVVGSTYIGVNTLHHQAVERLGDGLTAVAWSTDEPFDLIEAIEARRSGRARRAVAPRAAARPHPSTRRCSRGSSTRPAERSQPSAGGGPRARLAVAPRAAP